MSIGILRPAPFAPAGRRISTALAHPISAGHRFVDRISNLQPAHARKPGKFVSLRPCSGPEVFHGELAHQQRVCNQRTVAAPSDRLRAQYRRRFCRQPFQPRQPALKICRLHIIGKTAKAGIVPAQIFRICFGMPQPAEFFSPERSRCAPRANAGPAILDGIADGCGNAARCEGLPPAARHALSESR
jgi:hypothetical protein